MLIRQAVAVLRANIRPIQTKSPALLHSLAKWPSEAKPYDQVQIICKSIVLDVLECLGGADGLPESVAVLDVASKVADAGVEDVVQGVLPEEEVADNTHASGVFVVDPQPAQIRNRVDGLFHLTHLPDEVLEGHSREGANRCHYIAIFFNKSDDGLSVVLGNVLGFIFKLFLVHLFTIVVVRIRRVLILRDALLLRDDPRLLIEVIGGSVCELRHDRVTKLHDRGVPIFLLDDMVKHAIIFMELVVVWEDVVELYLAQALTLVVVVAVVVVGEVED